MNGQIDITCQEMETLPENTYLLVDIRSASALDYGTLPGAVHIPEGELEERTAELPKDRKIILCCARGIFSRDRAQELKDRGFEAYSLKGGYAGWLLQRMKEQQAQDEAIKAEKEQRAQDETIEAEKGQRAQEPDRDGQGRKSKEAKPRTKAQEVEEGIRKKFHKQLFSRFAKAINVYDLVQENDKIAVCISGGKDSMLMAKLFQELKRHNKFPFELVFLVMDPGYSEVNRKVIENNAKLLDIPITVFESDIFESVYEVEKSPCYLCARMRRGYLYSRAKELGCNKIALGHHYDDVIETILMGMLYGGQMQTMMPKLHSTNFEGMELIRPMYLIREDDIKKWRDFYDLHFIQCACRFTDTCTTCRPDGSGVSKRMEVKRLIAEMKKTNPFVESNIFKSVENVNLSTVIAYKENGVRHHFLDDYGRADDASHL